MYVCVYIYIYIRSTLGKFEPCFVKDARTAADEVYVDTCIYIYICMYTNNDNNNSNS